MTDHRDPAFAGGRRVVKYRSEKTGKEKKKNGLLLAALGSVCFLIVFMGALLWQMHSTEKMKAETGQGSWRCQDRRKGSGYDYRKSR